MGRWGLVGDGGTLGDVPTRRMYATAADAIVRATHIIIAAGAGMSADSGLPVYDGIAEVSAYKEAGVTYADLCKPSLLDTDPALALGFWGSCFNKYSETSPHDGYGILRGWCEGRRGWYVYTSNVDSHFRRSGMGENLCEIHGCLDTWMPSEGRPGMPVVLPLGHKFGVDRATLRLVGAAPEESGVPCDVSGAPMRPGVLMFEDEHTPLLAALRASQDKYQAWEARMEEEMQSDAAARLVIVEVGCGLRVPAVRLESEEVVRDTLSRLGQSARVPAERWWEEVDAGVPRVLIVRINPDYPENPRDPGHSLPLRAGALQALRAIQECMQSAQGTNGQGSQDGTQQPDGLPSNV